MLWPRHNETFVYTVANPHEQFPCVTSSGLGHLSKLLTLPWLLSAHGLEDSSTLMPVQALLLCVTLHT